MEIDSLAQFIRQIKEMVGCEDGSVRFYRGQPLDKDLVPNTFRKQCFINNESEMYNEIVNKKPEEFSSSKCTFDHLVKMQHYYIPTRLLDITTNPMVALYFACCEVPKDGTDEHKPIVYCIDIPTNLMKNYNSDSVTILSSLARYDKDSKEKLLHHVEFLNRIRNAFIKTIINLNSKDLNYSINVALKSENLDGKLLDLLEKVKGNLLLDDLLVSFKGTVSQWIKLNVSDVDLGIVLQKILKRIGEKSVFARANKFLKKDIKLLLENDYTHIIDDRLLHEIRQDKPYFQDLMHIDTFNTIYCVKPRLDNPRIIRQNGAFLIFPHARARLENNLTITKILIDKSKISSIVDELSVVDVNKESLFNDMDTVCLAIKGKYENTK